METTISRRLLLTEYTNPFNEKRTVLKDSNPVNDNCHEINISENELAALRRVLVKPVLEELAGECADKMRLHPDDAPYNYGIEACISLIHTKLNPEGGASNG